nr:hypothetical protein [Tanacetum cinerariifolium]
MICRQVESVDGYTDVVPFTYQVGGSQIQFGREEFCLITGLRFGVEFSSHYLVGPISFRRWVFESNKDGNHITSRMLLAKIKSKEFDTLENEDVVGVLSDMYPWGSYAWPTLYRQLRNANVKWWEAFYATPVEPDSALPKFLLMGFTWAFKGAQPNRRLTPDAFEAQAEWWVSSRASFEGHIREPPQISSPINQRSRDDVPGDIYRHMAEQDRLLKEAWTKVDAHDSLINHMNASLQGMQVGTMSRPMKVSVDVREHYGLTTTVAPKKRADKSRNETKNTNVLAFDLGKAVVDENAQDDEVMITGARATEDCVSSENVDPN